jgi:hypothetical protein
MRKRALKVFCGIEINGPNDYLIIKVIVNRTGIFIGSNLQILMSQSFYEPMEDLLDSSRMGAQCFV